MAKDGLIAPSRKETIYSKGFDMLSGRSIDYRTVGNEFKKIKVGVKTLDDAVLNLGVLQQHKIPFGDKKKFFDALMKNDYKTLREFSRFFYKSNGIYQKLCQYVAFMYRYDWYIVPEILDDSVKHEKILKDFSKMLSFLDNSYIKKICGDMALKVIVDGCYYGYLVPSNESIIIQELPIEYCRSRYYVKGMPAIEFNMAYFDTFADANYRMRILNLFPDEFKKGYMLYKQGKLQPDVLSDVRVYPTEKRLPGNGWYLLEPGFAFKFNLNNSDIPAFINVIPTLLDLDEAQGLDRRKQMQKLLKIIIQKLPLDKNGDLIFDVDEARDIHNNAVAMLQRAIGVDVLTTFADVESIDMADKNTTTTTDDLAKVERTVYNAAGISKNIFNTDGNLALEKSVLEDESSIRNLLFQFIILFDKIVQDKNSNRRKYAFRFYMLETTQYNYLNLAKLYKEQSSMGHSKILTQIALGHSQSFILNTAHFENDVLHLAELMLPNLMSSTMNLADLLGKNDKTDDSKTQKKTEEQKLVTQSDEKSAGRPAKDNDQKSEKTIQNQESMS